MEDNESVNNSENPEAIPVSDPIFLNQDTDSEENTSETPPPPPNTKKNKPEKKKTATTPIIIKKSKKKGEGSHGGAWKIAYADFVTAMMAFFLLMWLLAALNKAQKEGIAEYFKQPLKIALFVGKEKGDRSENIQGGGPDFTQKDGQVNAAVMKKKVTDDTEAKAKELEKLKNMEQQVEEAITTDPSLAALKKQLIMDITKDGLRIQLIDDPKNPMFDMGGDQISPQMEKVLIKLSESLKKMPNKISIQGHTDAHPYDKPEELKVSNWELSTQRANNARRILAKAGVPENKIVRVTGFADTALLDKKNPLNPINRRITIIVMKKDAEDALLNGE